MSDPSIADQLLKELPPGWNRSKPSEDKRQERINLIAIMAAAIYSGFEDRITHVNAVQMSISRAKDILQAAEQACPP